MPGAPVKTVGYCSGGYAMCTRENTQVDMPGAHSGGYAWCTCENTQVAMPGAPMKTLRWLCLVHP